MIKKSINQLEAIILVSLMLFNISFLVSADNISLNSSGSSKKSATDLDYIYSKSDYENYIANYSDDNKIKDSIVINSTEFLLDEQSMSCTSNMQLNDAVCLDVNGYAVFNINVSQSGFYNFAISYLSSRINSSEFNISLMIDGELPFSDLSNLSFNTYWENAKRVNKYDDNNNELTPEQKLTDSYITQRAADSTGVIVDPYLIYLSEGSHTIKIISLTNAFVTNEVSFCVPEQTVSYETLQLKKENGNSDEVIYIEGENANLKSSNSLVPKSSSNAAVSPKSAFSSMLNYIGSTTWQSPGQKLIYNFDVKESGYYKIAFNYKQSDVINGDSYRWLKIDGKTPFTEAKAIKFSYSVKWKYLEFSNDEEPYLIWLDKGGHTLSLEVTLGSVSQYYRRLADIVSILGKQYTKIAMITGDTPDPSRDYELFKQLPDLDSVLKDLYGKLNQLSSDTKKMAGKKASQYSAALDNMKLVLKNMRDNPYYAHQYVSSYYSNYCTVSSWLYEMKEMPLSLDQIQIVPSTMEYPGNKTSAIDSFVFSVESFLASFSSQYKSNSKSNANEGLEIWVNWGGDQASTLKQLIQDSFTLKTGIPVNVRVTNASLIKGILSGHFPDLSLHLSRTEPVNLGIRGALYDLSQFDDYESVITNFSDSATIPYQYNGEVYALPDTQSFYVMYCRNDILKDLGLETPQTWNDFIKAITVIQHKNMQVYIPYTEITTTTTVNTGLGGLNLFPTLLMQKDISLYNETKTKCILNTTPIIEVFDFWTNLYKNYNCLKEANFYNRFKVGTMPLGIDSYATYLTLKTTAPEIEGKWSIALVPGFSTGNHTVSGAGTGCSIIKKSKHKKEAWEFLKWWVSSDTQLRYSNQLEALLGKVGRVHSSNIEAVSKMDWDVQTKDILLKQWEYVNEVPEVPGSYYLTRAIDQAFWSSINKDMNTKSTLAKWEKTANQEIQRKINEYIN